MLETVIVMAIIAVVLIIHSVLDYRLAVKKQEKSNVRNDETEVA